MIVEMFLFLEFLSNNYDWEWMMRKNVDGFIEMIVMIKWRIGFLVD